MAIYEVYLPPQTGVADAVQRDSARFVPDSVSIIALILPVVWLAWNRLWFWLAAYLIVSVFLNFLGTTSFAMAAAVLTLLPGLFVYLEGSNMLSARLAGNGWDLVDLVDGTSEENARLRWLDRQDAIQVPAAAPLTTRPGRRFVPPRDDRPAFGLFGEE